MWLTGYSGAGKTTLAQLVADALTQAGCLIVVVDGDQFRAADGNRLGFSRKDRDANVARMASHAADLLEQGIAVVVSAISPYREARDRARTQLESLAPFLEVHVSTPLTTCMRRDPKGLYRRAAAGLIHGLSGVDDPYEPPLRPDLIVNTDGATPLDSVQIILDALYRMPRVETRADG